MNPHTLIEKGLLPDAVIRFGIRRLLRKTLRRERRDGIESQQQAIQTWVDRLNEAPIAIETDGRNVRIAGPVNSVEERQDILTAARRARLLVQLEDDLVVLPTADPYRLTARKDSNGSIAFAGNVPDAATHEVLLTHARSISKGAGVSDELIMAAGVPQGDWPGMIAERSPVPNRTNG